MPGARRLEVTKEPQDKHSGLLLDSAAQVEAGTCQPRLGLTQGRSQLGSDPLSML